jgi:large subunit ribosomal protein L35
MNKAKTNKGASKRFKVTAKGKIMRGNANTGHLKRHKTKSHIRRQMEPKEVSSGDKSRLERMLHIV